MRIGRLKTRNSFSSATVRTGVVSQKVDRGRGSIDVPARRYTSVTMTMSPRQQMALGWDGQAP